MSVVSTVGVGAAGGATAGAVGGAVAGSVVPVFGTAAGAVIGGVIGFFAGAAGGGAATTKAADIYCAENLETLIANRDLGIIDDDDTNTLMKEIKKINHRVPESELAGLVIKDRNQVSAKLVATISSRYETDSFVELKYIVSRNLRNTAELLTIWNKHYDQFISELQRQIREDINSFSPHHLKTWKDDKNFQVRSLLHDLRQDIEIIINNNYIRKLYARVLDLENDLIKLKLIVEKMQANINCQNLSKKLDVVPSVASKFEMITEFVPKVIAFAPQSATVVPVVGYIFAGLSILNSASCFLDNL